MRMPLVFPALLFAAAAIAQAPPPSGVARVDVKVINVDVSAVDGGGHPVTDLTRDDFEILEDDQPKPITNFAVATRNGPSAPRDDLTVRFRRRVVLLVDNNYIDRNDREAALRAVDTFVDEVFDGSYECAVGMIGQQLDILLPFTTDKAAIHAAIAQVRKARSTTFREDMNRDILSDPFRNNARGALDATVGFESRERTSRNARSINNSMVALVQAARAFATTEGKKLAVLLTGSMDLNTAFGGFGSGEDRELQDMKLNIAKLIDGAIREANAANMTIHVINAATRRSALQHDVQNRSSGLTGGAARLAATRLNSSADTADDSSPFAIANGTGGLYLTSSALKQSFETIDANARHFYLLGYAPGHDDDRQYHHIVVRTKRPGVKLSHRQGYLDLSADERLEQLLRMRVSLLQPSTNVPVTVNVQTPPSPDGKPIVSVLAAMPMARVTFLPNEGRFAGRVHVYLSIFDAKGNNVGFHHQTQDLMLTAAQREKSAADAFRYRLNVRLDRGEFTIAVTLRDDLSNEIGTAVQKLRL